MGGNMLKLIKNIVVFGIQVLTAALIFTLLEELLNKIISWVYFKCKGISSIEQENLKMEQYYKKHGVYCEECTKWFPISFKVCPLCNNKLSILATINNRLELSDNGDI